MFKTRVITTESLLTDLSRQGFASGSLLTLSGWVRILWSAWKRTERVRMTFFVKLDWESTVDQSQHASRLLGGANQQVVGQPKVGRDCCSCTRETFESVILLESFKSTISCS